MRINSRIFLLVSVSFLVIAAVVWSSFSNQVTKTSSAGSGSKSSQGGTVADPYASTTVVINIPTDASFTMTVLGCAATTITGTSESAPTNSTGQISFNASFTSQKEVNAQSITGAGTSCSTPTVQSGITNPIMVIQPAGNVNLNFSIRVDAGIPSDVAFKFNGTLWNVTDGCLGTPAPQVNSVVLSTGYQLLARNINKTSCAVNITAFANFSSSAPGERKVGELLTNGTNLNG